MTLTVTAETSAARGVLPRLSGSVELQTNLMVCWASQSPALQGARCARRISGVVCLLCDSHCHLDWFGDPEKVVQNALDEGVEKMLSNSTGISSIAKNVELAASFPPVKCALGIHPVDLLAMGESEIEGAFAKVEGNISAASAIGEVGLDFKRASTPGQRQLQERVFRRFISIGLEHGKPIVVHARFAEQQCLKVLEEMQAEKVHLHWFTNSAKLARKAVDSGYFISCGPIIISDSASAMVVKDIPLENLLLETDAPVSFQGKQSEPAWITGVCKAVAKIKGITPREVSSFTGRNFNSLFR